MNRIDQLFRTHKDHILSIYFCAGTPTLEGTAEVIRTLERKGVQMIEVGIPFSDPMADGPVIQHAATQALRNGMTFRTLFSQLEHIRPEVQMPLVLMGYLNPIMQYGFENFCKKCQECGIDGVIIPDLPFKDYMNEYRPVADKYGLHVIMLITPEPAKNVSAKSTNTPMDSSTWSLRLPSQEHRKNSMHKNKPTSSVSNRCTCGIHA